MSTASCAVHPVIALIAPFLFLACEISEPGLPLPPLHETAQFYLAEGERRIYDVKLSTGQILRLRTDQDGLDVVLSLEPPNGSLQEFDSGNAFHGPEWLVYRAQATGRHRVKIHGAAAEHSESPSKVVLTVESLGDAESSDLVLLQAYDILRSTAPTNPTPQQIADLERLLDTPTGTIPELVRSRVAYLLGRIYRFAGRPREAAGHLRLATDGFRDFGNVWEETTALNHLGFTLFQLGELSEAGRVLTRADELGQQTDQPRTRASTWTNLGIVHAARGRHSEALRYHRSSAELFEAIHDEEGIAYCRNNIGLQLLFLGEIEAGLNSLQEAVDLWRRLDRPADLATTYLSLAWGFALRSELTDRKADLETSQRLASEAVSIFESEDSGWDLGVALEQRGWYRLQLGDPKLALKDLGRAAKLADDSMVHRRSSWINLGLGTALSRMGKTEQARTHLERSLRGFTELGHHTGQVEAHLELARLERSAGDSERAADLLEQAIVAVEAPRQRIQTAEFRRSYLAIHQDVYQELVDLWAEASWDEMSIGSADPLRAKVFAERALEASERGRARGLLDRLNESDRRWAGTEPGEALRRALSSLETQALLPYPSSDQEPTIREKPDPEGLSIDAVGRARLEWWQALETDRSIASRTSTAAWIADFQTIYSRLDDATTIVLYSLGRQRSWAFIVTAESLQVVPLAPRPEIESVARRAQHLIVRSDSPGSRTAAEEALQALGELIWEPLSGRLTTDRVGVVAGGALLGVPLAALPDAGGRPLVASRSFVHLPSLSILQHLRRRLDPSQTLGESRLTIIADPVFGAADPRLSALKTSTASQQRGWSLPRLPGTRTEARHIETLLVGLQHGPETKTHLGFEANADLFHDGDLEESRFLHIATHGLVDDHDPAVAGLVFSLYDSEGRPRDGLLPARDLYRADLDADLVVLSACRTGQGQAIRGEGLVGFSHAFFAAGARHLVVSLWDVDDEATAELMRRYYSHLFQDRLEPVLALRMAQNGMRNHGLWSSPEYWAGFQAWGDWHMSLSD